MKKLLLIPLFFASFYAKGMQLPQSSFLEKVIDTENIAAITQEVDRLKKIIYTSGKPTQIAQKAYKDLLNARQSIAMKIIRIKSRLERDLEEFGTSPQELQVRDQLRNLSKIEKILTIELPEEETDLPDFS